MNKHKQLKEIEKKIRKQLRAELPNCKFTLRSKESYFNSTVEIHLMAANFEELSKPIEVLGYALLNPLSFLDERTHVDYECDGAYLTPEAWDAFKKVVKIIKSLKLGDNVYLNLYIGKADQPFEKIEKEAPDDYELYLV